MYSVRQRGFTLVEMLVVISLIGILSAALITQVSKARDVARAVKCKANLRNLAQAALNYAVDTRRMPWAGSHEYVEAIRTTGNMEVRLRRGWVDWTKNESLEHWPKYYSGNGSSMSGGNTMQTDCSGKAGYLSVTNGTLWSYTGRELSSYVCEATVSKLATQKKNSVCRSYVMNSYFGYNSKQEPFRREWRDVWLDNLSSRGSSERLLLFAELREDQPHGDAYRAADGVLETKIIGYNDNTKDRQKIKYEQLGFNHQVGKQAVAHVAYADGHVDVFHVANATTLDKDEQNALVYFLCNGYDLPKKTTDWKIPN